MQEKVGVKWRQKKMAENSRKRNDKHPYHLHSTKTVLSKAKLFKKRFIKKE